MKIKQRSMIVFYSFLIPLSGCVSGSRHADDLGGNGERLLTLGIVQKEIYRGQSQAGVIRSLGSPNIITKDGIENETWVYDRIASESSHSSSALGGFGAALILAGGYSRSAGAVSSSQRSLTVVIKFTKNGLVESYSLHASKF